MFKNRRIVFVAAGLLLIAAALIIGARAGSAVVVSNLGSSSSYASSHPDVVKPGNDAISPDTPDYVHRHAAPRLAVSSNTPDPKLCEIGELPSWTCER